MVLSRNTTSTCTSIVPCMEEQMNMKKKKVPAMQVMYKECLKNHAASIGGFAIDGCGEFMPGGDQGTLEAIKCSACNCHRNFHRKHTVQISQPAPNSFMVMPYQSGLAPPSSSSDINKDDIHDDDHRDLVVVTRPTTKSKRFRTKFTQEQKHKMFKFAEKAEWKIHKVEDSVVQQFCQELGIKRRVLKVWMHNNKHTYCANKVTTTTTTATPSS
ncbi:hypothetical protein FNV43_RR13892 [Rhamnella rubrinervis]|uniref:ZF-HD dimerization-type domain-containing protein n=1 Tax=Rhamnella rubrinervis TaxID=2594499 RepID=A0A8K0MFS3_9ROSA|nr:hypothetical protein FNV43_RR13892 [Rhamnella rubrinervis]